jgi:Tol biopolymer transport system component
MSSHSNVGVLHIFDADGSNMRKFGQAANWDPNPSWSPDGKRLAYTAIRNNNQEIISIDIYGTDEKNLTTSRATDADPAWSPDGKQIAFTSNRTGHFRLYVMDADGSNLLDLLGKDQLNCLYPTWSADGKQIVYGGKAANNTVQVFIVNANGEAEQQITDRKNLCSYAAWSPDNRFVAYVHYPWPAGSPPPSSIPKGTPPGADLWIYDVINGTHTRISSADIPTNGPRPAWKPLTK